jgi:hypothetical protein
MLLWHDIQKKLLQQILRSKFRLANVHPRIEYRYSWLGRAQCHAEPIHVNDP